MSRSQPSTTGVDKIKFDLLGHRRLIFAEEGLTYATDELYPVPLPIGLGTVSMSSQGRIRYADIRYCYTYSDPHQTTTRRLFCKA